MVLPCNTKNIGKQYTKQQQGLLCEIRELQASQGADQGAPPHTPMPAGVPTSVEPGSAGSDMVMDAPTP